MQTQLQARAQSHTLGGQRQVKRLELCGVILMNKASLEQLKGVKAANPQSDMKIKTLYSLNKKVGFKYGGNEKNQQLFKTKNAFRARKRSSRQ